MAISERELQIHFSKALRDAPDASVFAFRWKGSDVPVERVQADGHEWKLQLAPSELAIRDALVQAKRDGAKNGQKTVLLTPLKNGDVEYDVLARLADNQISQFDPWESLRPMFDAGQIDSRLRHSSSMRRLGEALMRCSSDGGSFAPVKGGVLGPKHAWAAFYKHGLGFDGEESNLEDWLLWTVQESASIGRLYEDFDDIVAPFRERLTDVIGPVAELFVAVLDASRSQQKLPASLRPEFAPLAVGLSAHASYRAREEREDGAPAPIEAIYGLKQIFGDDRKPTDEELKRYGEIAGGAWQRLQLPERYNRTNGTGSHESSSDARQMSKAVDSLLKSLVGDDAAHILPFSPASDSGWSIQVEELVAQIRAFAAGDSSAEAVQESLESLREHFGSRQNRSVYENLKRLAQLAAYLRTSESEQSNGSRLVEQARNYLLEGSFADALRQALTAADKAPALESLAHDLLDRALDASDDENESFGERYAAELGNHEVPPGFLGVQDVLEDVVEPLAADKPVLFVVLDGMSWAVARELLFDSAFEDWDTWVPAEDSDSARERPVAATVPSETTKSRASLLTGELQEGGQSTESNGFEKKLMELGVLKSRDQAHLFHKAEVDGTRPGGLSPDIRSALANDDNRVVGVVINTIDDQLSGSDQISLDWDLDTIAPLRSLLDYAGNRTIVLASDHGHIWEAGTEREVSGTSARWRSKTRDTVDGEYEVSGPTIQKLTGANSIYAAWSERIRYTRNKAGYHGGISRQELVTPLVVLRDQREAGEMKDGPFTRLSTEPPFWWNLEPAPRTTSVPDTTSDSTEDDPQLTLLSEDSEVSDVDTDWIVDLVNTDIYQQQLERHGGRLDPQLIPKLLAYLQANGDRMSISAVARLLNRSKTSTRNLLSVVGTVVNLEGYQSIKVAPLEGIVELDRDMIERQFRLG